jgi:hypothetical protein
MPGIWAQRTWLGAEWGSGKEEGDLSARQALDFQGELAAFPEASAALAGVDVHRQHEMRHEV